MSTTEPRKVVAIVGAGDAIGAAVGRRFAKGGYTVCLIRRSLEKAAPHVDAIVAAGGQAQAFSTDARDEGAVVALFETIERDVGPLEACLFNAGANTRAGALETSGMLFQRVWQLACFAGFVTGREAARHMLLRGRGTILFTGATASLRRLRRRQGRAACHRAKPRARVRAERDPHRAPDHRRGCRQSRDPSAAPRASWSQRPAARAGQLDRA
jgi:NAD(P)-dependent dehydrogenase (short-subunit alcohol dehydrogenase family)